MGEGEGEAAAGGGQELFENLQADSDTEEAAEERSHDQQIDFLNRKARERHSHLAEVFHTTVLYILWIGYLAFSFLNLHIFPIKMGNFEFGWLA